MFKFDKNLIKKSHENSKKFFGNFYKNLVEKVLFIFVINFAADFFQNLPSIHQTYAPKLHYAFPALSFDKNANYELNSEFRLKFLCNGTNDVNTHA